MNQAKRLLFVVFLAVTFVITACGPTATEPPAPADTAVPQVEPTEAPAEPTEVQAEPAEQAEATAEPTQAPAEPTQAPTEPVETRGVFRYNAYWEPQHGNPILVGGEHYLEYMFDALFRMDADGNFVPRLAESWEISEDGLTYTFYLRQDVKWHDGEPFTANDVVFTINAILDPATETALRENLQVNGEDITCTALDDATVQFTLPQPYSPFIYKIPGINIVPEHLLQGVDINTADFNQNPVGTGPFKWDEHVAGDYITFSANDDFYLGKPGCKAVILRVVPDSAASVAALKAGELDMVESEEPPDHEWAAENGYADYWSMPGGIMYLWLNPGRIPAFGDVQVRQALSYALDREALSKVYNGSEPAYNVLSPYGATAQFYNPDVTKYEYNVDKAKELLTQAGWTDTDGDGIVDKDGQNLSFTIIGQTGWKTAQDMLTVIQAFYKEIGVDMQLQLLESSAFRSARFDPEVADASFTGSPSPVDPDDLRVVYQSEGGRNTFGYVNERVDELFAQGMVEPNVELRKEIYSELQKLVVDDTPYIPTVYFSIGFLVSPKVTGLPADLRGVDPDYYQAYFPEDLNCTE